MATGHSIPRILVLGAGFGGLYLTLDLVRRLRRARLQAEITLLDQNNYFLFSPLLHEVTVDMVAMSHVVHPVRQFLRGMPVTFYETPVEQIDLERKTVHTGLGDLAYDYLVIALGSITNFFGSENIARVAFPLKTLGEAFRLRNHIISLFELAGASRDPALRRQLLTFVQAGAGFTGIETISELHDWVHRSLLKDYPMIRPHEVRFIMVDALPGLPAPTDPGLAAHTLRLIRNKGIDVRFNTPVEDAGIGWVELCNGERVATNTLIWSAGVSACPVVNALPVDKGNQRRVMVGPTLQLPGHPEVFALGDNTCFLDAAGKPLPATAQVVNQQAPVGAANIVRLMQRETLQPFRYKHLGELASLGEYKAVAHIGPLKLTGFTAWWLWRTVYLARMPWWGDRFRIAADWTLDLFFPRDSSRIEVGACPECTLQDCPFHHAG